MGQVASAYLGGKYVELADEEATEDDGTLHYVAGDQLAHGLAGGIGGVVEGVDKASGTGQVAAHLAEEGRAAGVGEVGFDTPLVADLGKELPSLRVQLDYLVTADGGVQLVNKVMQLLGDLNLVEVLLREDVFGDDPEEASPKAITRFGCGIVAVQQVGELVLLDGPEDVDGRAIDHDRITAFAHDVDRATAPHA